MMMNDASPPNVRAFLLVRIMSLDHSFIHAKQAIGMAYT